jgi:hypothetical protein
VVLVVNVLCAVVTERGTHTTHHTPHNTYCGVTGPTQPRLTDRVRGRQARLRKKELDAEKKAKEKDKKQEKVDKDKRARERGRHRNCGTSLLPNLSQ